MMKSLRKSLNGNKDSIRSQISTPLPIPLPSVSRPSTSVAPPQKVIRALAAYRPQAPQELPFQKGDFFYVVKDVDIQGAWFEAHNPVSGARGLVPRSMFEEFGKSATTTSQRASHISMGPPVQLAPIRSPQPPLPPQGAPPKSPKTQVFYAVVLHDFTGERADELDAKRGDSVSVVAQSNREWFVAKPIGRLGRPGLIPVSFVEIRDPATNAPVEDVEALMDRGDLPRVEDWKRAMFDYKQNSIALGVIDDTSSRTPIADRNQHSQQPIQSAPPIIPPVSFSDDSTLDALPTPEMLPEGILLSADVVSFHFEMDEYWFRVDAIYQPYPLPGQTTLPPARQLVLFRVYNDFYDFQVNLLDTFPREAGRKPPHPRLLPYMPGPVEDVDDNITATRKDELGEFTHKLCELSKIGARYILEHPVVREFLSLKPGDVENAIEPRSSEMEELNEYEQSGAGSSYEAGDGYGEAEDKLGNMRLSKRGSDGSEYEDEGYATSPQRSLEADPHPYSNGGYSHTQDKADQLRYNLPPSHRAGSSRSNSPMTDPRSNQQQGRGSEHQRASDLRYSEYDNEPSPSARSSQAPSIATSGRSRNGSTTAKLNTPPISAVNSQTAFVKIKIFDRVSDDLIAIRVHPKISHGELMDKVQARLGGEVANLNYRDSVSAGFVGLDSDDALRYWLEGTEKHVLYAD